MQRLTNDEFIERAGSVHSGAYSYGSTVYTHSQSKVTITCPLHGEFEQRPVDHLRGYGCKHCGWGQK